MMFSFSQNVLSVKFVSAAFTMMLLSACTLKTEAPIINVDASDDIVIYGSLPADQALDLKMTARFESNRVATLSTSLMLILLVKCSTLR